MLASKGWGFLNLYFTWDQWWLANTASFRHWSRACKRLSQPRAAAYRRTTTSDGSTILWKHSGDMLCLCTRKSSCLRGKYFLRRCKNTYKTKITCTKVFVLTIIAIVIIQLCCANYLWHSSLCWRLQCCQRRTLTTTRQSLNISNRQSGKKCLQTLKFSPFRICQGLTWHNRCRCW